MCVFVVDRHGMETTTQTQTRLFAIRGRFLKQISRDTSAPPAFASLPNPNPGSAIRFAVFPGTVKTVNYFQQDLVRWMMALTGKQQSELTPQDAADITPELAAQTAASKYAGRMVVVQIALRYGKKDLNDDGSVKANAKGSLVSTPICAITQENWQSYFTLDEVTALQAAKII